MFTPWIHSFLSDDMSCFCLKNIVTLSTGHPTKGSGFSETLPGFGLELHWIQWSCWWGRFEVVDFGLDCHFRSKELLWSLFSCPSCLSYLFLSLPFPRLWVALGIPGHSELKFRALYCCRRDREWWASGLEFSVKFLSLP